MKQTRTAELSTGLFILFGILALFFLATQTTGFKFGNKAHYQVTAVFSNVGGLKVRAPVKMAGVKIGSVKSIDFDSRRFQAVVTFNINSKYDQLPKDSTASILTAGLLGGEYIGLSAGFMDTPLKAGSRIPISHTTSAVILEHLISEFVSSMGS